MLLLLHATHPLQALQASSHVLFVPFFKRDDLLPPCRYPSTVATHSRRARDVIEAAFERSVDGGRDSPLLGSRLHDFGFRGCTCLEQSVLGGVAHLLNFEGTDTLSAAYYAQVCPGSGHAEMVLRLAPFWPYVRPSMPCQDEGMSGSRQALSPDCLVT